MRLEMPTDLSSRAKRSMRRTLVAVSSDTFAMILNLNISFIRLVNMTRAVTFSLRLRRFRLACKTELALLLPPRFFKGARKHPCCRSRTHRIPRLALDIVLGNYACYP